MDTSILIGDIFTIFALSIAVLFIFHRMRLPPIVGFLLTGVLAGPHGLSLIEIVEDVEVMAEIGVVLLLFTIGIEFSLKNLSRIRRLFFVGGSLQVLLTIGYVTLIAEIFGLSTAKSIFIGFVISLSSTAIVIKLLQDRGEIDSPHGQTALGILLFQDFIIVPMMLLTPVLAGSSDTVQQSLLLIIIEGIGIILLVVISAKWIVPYMLHQVAKTQSKELFILSVVVICLAIAYLTSSMGLSLALGAFLAGLIISESEYSHEALEKIDPFKDLFASLFFISIGMLLDLNFLLNHLVLVLAITLGILVAKSMLAGFSTVIMGLPVRTAILAGFSLSQVGEFSFILSHAGFLYGLISQTEYQFLLAGSIITMAVTPFMMAIAPHFATFVSHLPISERLITGGELASVDKKEPMKDHLIIIGFGINGRYLAKVASGVGIPYVIIETNPETVRVEREGGEPIFYGDATRMNVLREAWIENARIVVIATSDPIASRRITELARKLNSNLYIIVRTRYLQEVEQLSELGADEVIPEEFEASMEIFARVLYKYLVPRDEIENYITEVRRGNYEMLRSLNKKPLSLSDIEVHLSDLEIGSFRVEEASALVGKTLSEIGLRRRYGITVLAIIRDSNDLPNPDGGIKILEKDTIIALGRPDELFRLSNIFSGKDDLENP
ncbi:MAG: glutathione-regulated potassium-efflux system protein KefC [Candidatus Syntrophoarchaeum sp. GoM_oil]|nr:MAG: glutathione-regulated potassium-efflux system protein KefC [Candidatus Syntrophoarchaeum sp. GoM_oil]